MTKRDRLIAIVVSLDLSPATIVFTNKKTGAGYIVDKTSDKVFVRWTSYDRGIEVLNAIHEALYPRQTTT